MTQDPIDLSPYRSILCLHGNLPPRAFFSNLKLPVIAADGAANLLEELGVKPSIIIGDLDAVSDSIREKNKVLYLPDQNSNDFTKSLNYLQENNLLPALILGINGGLIDHILNNINLFMNSDSVFYAPPILGYVLKEKTEKTFSLMKNTKLSIFGIPSASISSNGLKWELNNADLAFPGMNSCFNRTLSSEVQIKVHQGLALLLVYLQPMDDAGAR